MCSGVGTNGGFSDFVNHHYSPDQNVVSKFSSELGSGNSFSDRISVSLFDHLHFQFHGFQDHEFKEENLLEGGRVSNSIVA